MDLRMVNFFKCHVFFFTSKDKGLNKESCLNSPPSSYDEHHMSGHASLCQTKNNSNLFQKHYLFMQNKTLCNDTQTEAVSLYIVACIIWKDMEY